MTEQQIEVDYFCDPNKIEANAKEQLEKYSRKPELEKLCAFTDVHYCDEKAIPVGVAFSTKGVFYPMVTGKDLGCGVSYARISKEFWKGSFDKKKHYMGLEKAHREMTDDGLGGGNHFLSIEEDATHVYVICHTGSRNRGIAMYQRSYELQQNYSAEAGDAMPFVDLNWMRDEDPSYENEYYSVTNHAYDRRVNFVLKTIVFLQRAGYIDCKKEQIPDNYLHIKMGSDSDPYPSKEILYGTPIEFYSSMHNHLDFKGDTVIHRKGSTEINPGDEVAIPLSMTRGTLIVKVHPFTNIDHALNSCAHGAGRRLSRFDSMKHWKTVLKESERKAYKEMFSELLNRSGNFPSGYLQEFDYAYKDSSDILTMQPYLKKVTQTIPIVTIKYTEI